MLDKQAGCPSLLKSLEVIDPGERGFLEAEWKRHALPDEDEARQRLESYRVGKQEEEKDQLALDRELDQGARGREKPSRRRTTGSGHLPRKSTVNLLDLRCVVLARYVARVAALDPTVLRARQKYFGAPSDSISWEEADELLTRRWPSGPPARLADLIRTARTLAHRYVWTVNEAARFVLSGEGPVPRLVTASISVRAAGGPRATITVAMQEFAPHEAVESEIAAARSRLLGAQRKRDGARPLGEKNLYLFDYVSPRKIEFERELVQRRPIAAGLSPSAMIAALRERLPRESDLRAFWRQLWKECKDPELRRGSSTKMRRDFESTERLLFPKSYLRSQVPGRATSNTG